MYSTGTCVCCSSSLHSTDVKCWILDKSCWACDHLSLPLGSLYMISSLHIIPVWLGLSVCYHVLQYVVSELYSKFAFLACWLDSGMTTVTTCTGTACGTVLLWLCMCHAVHVQKKPSHERAVRQGGLTGREWGLN